MRALLAAILVATLGCFAVVVVSSAGCNDLGIGKRCLNPSQSDAGVKGTQISSPALECLSRLCLLQEKDNGASPAHTICTAKCTTNDDCASGVIGDPNAPMSGQCTSSFVCAIATIAGPFRCQQLCVCKDDLVPGLNSDGTGNVVCPTACQDPNTGKCQTP